MNGMRSNQQEFTVPIKGMGNAAALPELKLLRRILATDLKKSAIARQQGDSIRHLHVKKLTQDLLPYTDLPGGEPPLGAAGRFHKGSTFITNNFEIL